MAQERGHFECASFLEAAAAGIFEPASSVLALAEAGTAPFAPMTIPSCAQLLPETTISTLVEWASILMVDEASCFAAFYAGTGVEEGETFELCRVRFLTNAHGLRPIRFRLVAYLVAPQASRKIKADVSKVFLAAGSLTFIANTALSSTFERKRHPP